VEDLCISYRDTPIVRGLNFSLGRGERVGLIGESGSGKSLTALAIMGLLPDGLRSSGSILLGASRAQLIGATESTMSGIRGRQISMVFQEPMSALNPLMRVGRQVAEVIRIHDSGVTKAEVRASVQSLLEQVQLPEPALIARRYPHQLSGGQRQRVVLAIALANRPELLICDEPTTALDVTVEADMLGLIEETVSANEASLLFITHDLAVVASLCQRVLVMYGGRIVEGGPIATVLRRPRHQYTAGLIAASNLDIVDSEGHLPTIEGVVPEPGRFPAGCVFRNRCDAATEKCEGVPEWEGTSANGFACWHPPSVTLPGEEG
jgi:peptide/nickel transport system ATP-binding protein